jgi:ubiquinone/menaquinone biosynthesis C-methylase UbiE
MKSIYYNAISASYNELYEEEQQKKIARIKREISHKPGDYVLDLGSGTGFFDFPCCTVIRLDPSIQLLKCASGIKVLAKAENMPFPDSLFDLLVSVTALQNFEDINLAIAEIRRVTKPVAPVVLTFLKRSQKKTAICAAIEKNFLVCRKIEEDKDIIYILKNRKP